MPERAPKDNLVRAYRPGVELRADGDDGPPTMVGHFAVFDEWTEIDSAWEGNFLERLAPRSFRKAFQPGYRDQVKVLFQHGFDPLVGEKPIGRHAVLREDERGAWYEVPLLDAPYVRDNVLPGLEEGLYGASFRFRVTREDWDGEPDPSDRNPRGIPERTIREVELYEFGPVTFPAYAAATAGVRSATDHYLAQVLSRSRVLADLAADLAGDQMSGQEPADQPPDDDAGDVPTSSETEPEGGRSVLRDPVAANEYWARLRKGTK